MYIKFDAYDRRDDPGDICVRRGVPPLYRILCQKTMCTPPGDMQRARKAGNVDITWVLTLGM
jgi:hypothetical protein